MPRRGFSCPIIVLSYSCLRVLLVIAITLGWVCRALPQKENPPNLPPKFAVTTIRVNDSGGGGVHTLLTPDGVSIINIPMLNLLADAFGVQTNQIVGISEDLKHTRYDIQAKVADEDVAAMKKLSNGQKLALLQSVLTERFGLKSHPETRELAIYFLVVTKDGIRMNEWKRPDFSTGTAAPHGISRWKSKLQSQGTTMSDLAEQLSSILGRMVVDKTGLTANYDYTLEWSSGESSSGEDAHPSLLTALHEQLGLRLESAKGPVNVVVIDHIEQPSQN